MTEPKSMPKLIEAIRHLDDHIPLTPQERKELLPSPALLAAAKKRALDTIERAQQAQRRQALATATAQREEAVARLKGRIVHRPRAESLSLIQALVARSVAGAQHLAFYRDYESSPDEDLDLLVAVLQDLADSK